MGKKDKGLMGYPAAKVSSMGAISVKSRNKKKKKSKVNLSNPLKSMAGL